MRRFLISAASFGLLLTAPLAAHAQGAGVPTTGAAPGNPNAPMADTVTGSVAGSALSGPDQTRFRSYVVREHRPSVKMREQVAIGTPLPPAVEIYEVPAEVGVRTTYSYSVVNDRTVLVDPKTRKIVQIIE